jgi:23S rRNA (guanosine2251-2'-O)-methyltransferase
MASGKGVGRGAGEAGGRGGAEWLYGRHAVAAALANPRRTCHRLLATREALARLGPLAARPGLAVEVVPRARIERELASDAIHQGLLLQAAPLPTVALEAITPGPGGSLVVALDRIEDPRNMGAILRSAAAFGARAVLVPRHGSAQVGGAMAKAAAGALELVPLIEVTNLANALRSLKESGYRVVGLDAAAAVTLDAAAAAAHLVLVLGAESRGLRRLVGETCDLLVRIDTTGAVESLNVAVAAGIALHALARKPAAGGA